MAVKRRTVDENWKSIMESEKDKTTGTPPHSSVTSQLFFNGHSVAAFKNLIYSFLSRDDSLWVCVQVEHTVNVFLNDSRLPDWWSTIGIVSFVNLCWLLSRQRDQWRHLRRFAVGSTIVDLVGETSTASIGQLGRYTRGCAAHVWARYDRYTAPRITQSRGFFWNTIFICPWIWTLTTKYQTWLLWYLIHKLKYLWRQRQRELGYSSNHDNETWVWLLIGMFLNLLNVHHWLDYQIRI